MLRPQRNAQIPLRYRNNSPPQVEQDINRRKRVKIDLKDVDRNNVDQALTGIAPASESAEESSTLISTELPQFLANYTQNRA